MNISSITASEKNAQIKNKCKNKIIKVFIQKIFDIKSWDIKAQSYEGSS